MICHKSPKQGQPSQPEKNTTPKVGHPGICRPLTQGYQLQLGAAPPPSELGKTTTPSPPLSIPGLAPTGRSTVSVYLPLIPGGGMLPFEVTLESLLQECRVVLQCFLRLPWRYCLHHVHWQVDLLSEIGAETFGRMHHGTIRCCQER